LVEYLYFSIFGLELQKDWVMPEFERIH